MSYTATVVQVLLSSPSDLPQAHKDLVHAKIRSWNTNYSRRFGVVFLPTDWQEGSSPGYGGEPQSFINTQLVESSDLGLVIFTNRLGTPTTGHPSGTVEEIELLHSQGKRVAIFRNSYGRPAPAGTDGVAELERLENYLGSVQDKALFREYRSSEELLQALDNTLNDVARDMEVPAGVGAPAVGHTGSEAAGVWPSAQTERYQETNSKGRLQERRRHYLVLTNMTDAPVSDVSCRYDEEGADGGRPFDLSPEEKRVGSMAPGAVHRFPILRAWGSAPAADCVVTWTSPDSVAHETRATVTLD